MFIQTEITPNPATLKFLPGRDVMGEGTANFTDIGQAVGSPLARRLFELDGIAGVFLGSDFVTVTKNSGARMGSAEADRPRRHHGPLHFG